MSVPLSRARVRSLSLPDGTGVRDYIHIVDLAKGHVAAGQSRDTAFKKKEKKRKGETR